MALKLSHAKHNESVCNFLSKKPEYSDWIVITAFYSAIHFVDHKIFPLTQKTDEGQSFKVPDIDVMNAAFNPTKKDRHTLRQHLVDKHCNEVAASLKWLGTTCRTARYFNYKFDNPRLIANTAKEHLNKIKAVCEK